MNREVNAAKDKQEQWVLKHKAIENEIRLKATQLSDIEKDLNGTMVARANIEKEKKMIQAKIDAFQKEINSKNFDSSFFEKL